MQLLQSAVDAIEQTAHRVLANQQDFSFTSQTDLLMLSLAEEERVQKEETASNRERPELAAIQCLPFATHCWNKIHTKHPLSASGSGRSWHRMPRPRVAPHIARHLYFQIPLPEASENGNAIPRS